MVKVPEGWVKTTLGEIANWGSGGTPSRSNPAYYEGNIPWVKTGDLGSKVVMQASEHISQDAVQNSSAKLFPKGSVAMAMYGATIGKTSILGIDATTNQACAVGNPIPNVTTTLFLYYLLLSEKDVFITKGQGGAQPNISQAVIKEHEITFPPLAEQKIIADKLDTLLAQVEATKARLEAIPNILKRFRQSVLAAAISGKLTEEREFKSDDYYEKLESEIESTPAFKKIAHLSEEEIKQSRNLFDNPEWERWKLYPMEMLVEADRGIPYGIVQTGEPAPHGILTIRCGDVKPLKIDISDLKRVATEIESKYMRTRLKGGEVILAIRGTVGNAAVVSTELVSEKVNISREVAMIPVRKNISPKFIAMLIQSPAGYRCLLEKTKGVAQRGINLADVRRFVTPVPSLEEQLEITHRVEQLFTYADHIAAKADAALARVNNLTQSILAQAFRGELTADWRAANPDLISGENSAEVLLAKIKAERASVKTKKKP